MIPREVFQQTVTEFLAPVARYLEDASVSEVLINGPHRIFIERRGRLERVPERFDDAEEVLCALRNIAQFVGKTIGEDCPVLEARLPDGSRVQAVVAPAADDGPYVAIRRFLRSTLGMSQLVELNALTAEAASLLTALVRSRLNVVVAGGTGSGKTSLLNILAGVLPPEERLIVIEDSREIQVDREHVVYLEARNQSRSSGSSVSIRDLFRASLRMRPDRIVIGELRGGEALDLIQAMVSGHGGCLTTLHATYPHDTLTRLETMALMSDLNLPLPALRLQIGSAVQVIVQLGRQPDGQRVVTHIVEVAGYDWESQTYQLSPLFERVYDGNAAAGTLRSTLQRCRQTSLFVDQLQRHGHTQ